MLRTTPAEIFQYFSQSVFSIVGGSSIPKNSPEMNPPICAKILIFLLFSTGIREKRKIKTTQIIVMQSNIHLNGPRTLKAFQLIIIYATIHAKIPYKQVLAPTAVISLAMRHDPNIFPEIPVTKYSDAVISQP